MGATHCFKGKTLILPGPVAGTSLVLLGVGLIGSWEKNSLSLQASDLSVNI